MLYFVNQKTLIYASDIALVSTHEGIKKRYGFIFVYKNYQEEEPL